MELKVFLEDLLTKHAQPAPRPGPPMVLFDECVDLPTVVPVVSAGIRQNTVFASRALWTQLRRKADGTLFPMPCAIPGPVASPRPRETCSFFSGRATGRASRWSSATLTCARGGTPR